MDRPVAQAENERFDRVTVSCSLEEPAQPRDGACEVLDVPGEQGGQFAQLGSLRDVITTSPSRAGDKSVTANDPEAHLVNGLPEHGLVVMGTRVGKDEHDVTAGHRARQRRRQLWRRHRLLADHRELIQERDEGHDKQDEQGKSVQPGSDRIMDSARPDPSANDPPRG